MKNDQPLKIHAQTSDLKKIRRYIESRFETLGVYNTLEREDVILATMEAVTNILLHGYQGQKGVIEVEVTKATDSISVCLRDEAPPFDPTKFPAPDLSTHLKNRQMGGMGIHLIRQLMDCVSYHSLQGGENELILVKQVRFEVD